MPPTEDNRGCSWGGVDRDAKPVTGTIDERLATLPDRYPIWIGYDPAGALDQAIVVEITERGGRFLAFVPAAVVAQAVALAKGAAR